MPFRRGPLIAFSGLDGAGKSTQIERLRRTLDERARACVYVWARGGYTPGMLWLKRTLRRMPGRVLPPPGRNPARKKALGKSWVRRAWATLSMVDLMVYYAVVIRWLRLRGYVVLCDRYLDDTEIDFRLNFPGDRLERTLLWNLVRLVCPTPDRGYLFLIPVDESLRRSALKQEPFPDDRATLEARRSLYIELNRTSAWQRLDGCRPADELAAQIRQSVSHLCGIGDAAVEQQLKEGEAAL